MGKRIKTKLADKEYILEYDRKQFSKLEDGGYSLQKAIEQPLNYAFGTFKYAILKNNQSLSGNQIETLFDEFVAKYDVTEFIQWVQEQYTAFFTPIQSDMTKETLEFLD